MLVTEAMEQRFVNRVVGRIRGFKPGSSDRRPSNHPVEALGIAPASPAPKQNLVSSST